MPTFLNRMAVALAAVAICVVACIAAVGCSEAPAGGGGKHEAEFVFANRGKVKTLDPNQMSWAQDIRVAQALFEGVYTLDPVNLEPVLGAAQEVTHSDDYKTWTIRLRENARWSNGEAVTSDDFIFAWRRMMREPGYYSYLLNDYIAGAGDYAAAYRTDAASADFETVGLKKIDDKTFEVTLQNPTAFFPDLLAFTAYFPLHEKSMESFKRVEAGSGRVTYDAGFATAGNLVSNGAYVLQGWDQNTGQTLVMNEHYWDSQNVKSRTIRALDSDDFDLAFARYEDGLIDWITEVQADNAYAMRQEGRTDVHVFPNFGTYFWVFNTNEQTPDGQPNPVADARVRQALSMAVNKQEIVDTIARNGEMVATTFVPQNGDYFPGYPYPAGLPYDVEQAKSLLAQAGFPGGQGFPRVALTYDTDNPVHGAVAQNLARQWRQKLGVQFDLRGMEHLQFREVYKPKLVTGPDGQKQIKPGDFVISRGSWIGDYMDVTTFTDMFLPLSLNNTAAWVNQEYARLSDEAKRTADPEKRFELLGEAERIFLEDAAILPLYHYTNRFMHRDDVTGIARSPRNMVVLKNVQTPRSTGPGAQ